VQLAHLCACLWVGVYLQPLLDVIHAVCYAVLCYAVPCLLLVVVPEKRKAVSLAATASIGLFCALSAITFPD
jgi:hypothetical protein